MRLVFTKYPNATAGFFLHWGSVDLLKKYLWTHDIHVESLEVKYNFCWHFYDIHITAYNDEDTEQTGKAAAHIFQNDGHRVEIAGHGWRWVHIDDYHSREKEKRLKNLTHSGDKVAKDVMRIWVHALEG